MVWSHVALTALWGGLLAIERTAFLQAMFSRPLVAATGTGLILEDLASGVYVGLVFELFHLGGASLGGSHLDHETLPAVSAAAAASAIANTSGGPGTPAMWTLGILLFAPMGRVGAAFERALDVRAARYQSRAAGSVNAGELSRAVRQNLRAMWPHFVGFGLLSGFATFVGYLLAPLEPQLPLKALRGLAWAYPAMASMAAAVAVHGCHARHGPRIALVAATVVIAGASIAAVLGAPLP